MVVVTVVIWVVLLSTTSTSSAAGLFPAFRVRLLSSQSLPAASAPPMDEAALSCPRGHPLALLLLLLLLPSAGGGLCRGDLLRWGLVLLGPLLQLRFLLLLLLPSPAPLSPLLPEKTNLSRHWGDVLLLLLLLLLPSTGEASSSPLVVPASL